MSRSLQGSGHDASMQGAGEAQQQQQQHAFMQPRQAQEVTGAVGSLPLEADPASLGPLECWAEQAVSTPRDGVGAQQKVQSELAGKVTQQHSSCGDSSSTSSSSGGSGHARSEEGAHALAMALWSLAVMGWVPPLAWMEEVQDRIGCLDGRGICTALLCDAHVCTCVEGVAVC
eukprot:1159864-Pelagomonas_calceolata.AAC.8